MLLPTLSYFFFVILNMTMKILEISKVCPPLGSSPDVSFPLSFFDLLWLRFPPVESIFFYKGNFSLSVVYKLKNSLSITLRHFFLLAGNLVWPPSASKPLIRYKDDYDGVLFTVAQSDADFTHLSTAKSRETSIFHPLIAHLTETNSQVPLFAVKVTIFPSKGFCIGIAFHHAVSDANSFPALLKLWASICKLGDDRILNPDSRPTFDRKSIRERYLELEKLYIGQLLEQKGTDPRKIAASRSELQQDKVRGTFYLSTSDVKKIKEFIRDRLGNQKDKIEVTTFTTTLAHLIVCASKAKGRTGKIVSFFIVVNCRDRLEPPVSPYYTGNCVSFLDGDLSRDKLKKSDGIIAAVDAVYKTKKRLDDGVLKGAENWLMSGKIDSDEISIAGSTKLELYDIDFGWGRPIKVDMTSIDKTGAISLMEGRNGDIEIELSLKKQEMEIFACEFTQGVRKMSRMTSAL